MKLDEYIRAERGNAAALAAFMQVHKTQITNWAMGRAPIAPHRCVAIEQFTEGAVTRQELRDDWQLIWPELIPAVTPAPTPQPDLIANPDYTGPTRRTGAPDRRKSAKA